MAVEPALGRELVRVVRSAPENAEHAAGPDPNEVILRIGPALESRETRLGVALAVAAPGHRGRRSERLIEARSRAIQTHLTCPASGPQYKELK